MTTPLSPADLEGLQADLLKGRVDLNQLPAGSVAALEDYWRTNPNAQGAPVDPNQAKQLEQQRSAYAAAPDILNSAIFKPIEWVGSKLYWAYSNSISPIVSGAAIGIHNAIYGAPEGWEDRSSSDIWNTAKSFSPGQALWMLGLNNEEMKKRGLSFKDATKPAAQINKDKYFNTGAAKYATGATDLAVSWYMDPLVLTGKGIGAVRQATYVKPVSQQMAQAGKAATKAGLPASRAPELLAKTPTFDKMVNLVMDVKAKNPDTAALVLRDRLTTLKQSSNGDRLASLLSDAKDPQEVAQILRISMGDYAGYLGLEAKNMNLAYQLKTASTRYTALGTSYHAQSPAWQASPLGIKMKAYVDAQKDLIHKLNDETGFITDKMDAFATIDKMNFNRGTTPLGVAFRGSRVASGDLMKVRGSGPIKAVPALIYNAAVGFPIKMIRSYQDIKPGAYLDVHGENSYQELQQTLKPLAPRGKNPGILSTQDVDRYVADYIKATPNERGRYLMDMEKEISGKIADKYGVDHAVAHDLYDDMARRRHEGQTNAGKAKTFGTATLTDSAGLQYRVAEIEGDGGRMISTPLFDTQLANSHATMNFDVFESLIKNNGKAWEGAANKARGTWTASKEVADTLGSIWKFSQLFRLGYAPRALADDFLGQVARFGAVSMIDRTGRGTAHFANKVFNGTWAGSSQSALQAGAKATHEGLETHLADLGRKEEALKIEVTGRTAAGKDATKHQSELDDVQTEIAGTKENMLQLQNNMLKTASLADRGVRVGREIFAAPFGGQFGNMFRDLNSGERNFGNLMGRQADWYQNRMKRGDWEEIRTATHGVEKHSQAWARKINDQIAKSSIGRQALAGKDEAGLVSWMRSTPEGAKYRKEIGLKNISDWELARRVKAEVDHTIPGDDFKPGMQALRDAALEGNLKMKDLEDMIPAKARPSVNGESFKYAEGKHIISSLMDRGITSYYNIANQIPATKLLRNPLFAQQYKASLTEQMKVLKAQGTTHMDEALRQQMEQTARTKALADVKKYTFTMDHETKMAYSMRHFAAFFGAQQESWNRWGRIIAEKPQTLPHIAQVYGAPSRVGMVVDQNGLAVNGEGYTTDPLTGEKKMVDYSDRKILFQIPDYLGGKKLNKALGLDEGAKFVVPMSSVELVLNHGDGPLPVGAGPFVQLAANSMATNGWVGKVTNADPVATTDLFQKFGVLPFGPQDSPMDFILPTTGKRLGDSGDDLGQVKQRALLNMMQVEHFKFENGQRDTEPTWKELMDRADTWTMFRAIAAFVSPVSINQQDPYQYFRDEYARMQKVNPQVADEAFYEKYGDSFFSFTQSMSKNSTGLAPTADGVKFGKYYQDLISQVGDEYAPLIAGDNGAGVYSQGAYYYQSHHATGIGNNTPDRTKLGAAEAWKQSQISLGWKQYGQAMDSINADLFNAGFSSYDDDGAEQLKAQRAAIVSGLTQQVRPNGEQNTFYNAEWANEFQTLSLGKYDKRAVDMQKIVNDPELWSKAYDPKSGTVGQRSDIYTLAAYLNMRGNMQVALAVRKNDGGSNDITAGSNDDLLSSWNQAVTSMIEQDTKFGRLHSRWFPTDMGYNINSQFSQQQQLQQKSSLNTMTGTTQQAIPGMEG